MRSCCLLCLVFVLGGAAEKVGGGTAKRMSSGKGLGTAAKREGGSARKAGGMGGAKRSGAGAVAVILSALRLSKHKGTIATQEDLLRTATHLATPSRQLMFTTVTMDKPLFQLLLLRQWAGNLRGRLANALVIGTNDYTCKVMRNESIPCFVDKLAPQLTGKQNFFPSAVLLKWWYARALLEHSFHIIFSDPDIAWARDPFGTWDESYDLQVASCVVVARATWSARDLVGIDARLHTLHVLLRRASCCE